MALTTLTLDELLSLTPTGSMDRAILNNLKGTNILHTPNSLLFNKDMPGYTFFTRPQLNMQLDNIRNVREIASLINSNPLSVQTYTRTMLDPRLITGLNYKSGTIRPISCPIIDNLNAFIVPFSNNLLSISGFPSISVPFFDSTPGVYNEVYSIVDGRVINAGTYDITANLRNTRGDVNIFMLYVWGMYMPMVFEGKLIPYLDFITENELDYNTRIYRFVVDHSKRFITKYACANVAAPSGIPIGDFFDIPGDKAYSDANQQLSVRFKCNGFRVFDPIILKDFNDVVKIFNPSMEDGTRENTMIQVPYQLRGVFNFNRLYPRINLSTSELEWWCFSDVFNKVTNAWLKSQSSGSSATTDNTNVGD